MLRFAVDAVPQSFRGKRVYEISSARQGRRDLARFFGNAV